MGCESVSLQVLSMGHINWGGLIGCINRIY